MTIPCPANGPVSACGYLGRRSHHQAASSQASHSVGYFVSKGFIRHLSPQTEVIEFLQENWAIIGPRLRDSASRHPCPPAAERNSPPILLSPPGFRRFAPTSLVGGRLKPERHPGPWALCAFSLPDLMQASLQRPDIKKAPQLRCDAVPFAVSEGLTGTYNEAQRSAKPFETQSNRL